MREHFIRAGADENARLIPREKSLEAHFNGLRVTGNCDLDTSLKRLLAVGF